MKHAAQYPITFGYGATDGYYYGPNGTVGKMHRGNDRSTPTGTPIIISGTTIGKTGATGLVSGPHLHTQAGTDKACQNTINPTNLDFKAGTVVAVGNASQWGNYITVQVGSQYITYCHLSSINVKIGQKIGGSVLKPIYIPKKADIDKAWKDLYGTKPSQRNYDEYTKKDISWMWHDFAYSLKKKLDAEKKKPTQVNRASVIDYINKNLK